MSGKIGPIYIFEHASFNSSSIVREKNLYQFVDNVFSPVVRYRADTGYYYDRTGNVIIDDQANGFFYSISASQFTSSHTVMLYLYTVHLSASSGQVETFSSLTANFGSLTASAGQVASLGGTSANFGSLTASAGLVASITSSNGKISYLVGTASHFTHVTSSFLKSTSGSIDNIVSLYGNISNMKSAKFIGDVDTPVIEVRRDVAGNSNVFEVYAVNDGGSPEFYLTSNGKIRLSESGEDWEIMPIPASAMKTATAPPNFSLFRDNGAGSHGVYTYIFSEAFLNRILFSLVVPYSVKVNSQMYLILRISPTMNGAPGEKAFFSIEYTCANIDDIFPSTTVKSVIINVENMQAYSYYVEYVPIDNVFLSPGAVCMFSIERDPANENDNFNGKIALLSIDVAFKLNSLGAISYDGTK